jgi:hypothetical protein
MALAISFGAGILVGTTITFLLGVWIWLRSLGD